MDTVFTRPRQSRVTPRVLRRSGSAGSARKRSAPLFGSSPAAQAAADGADGEFSSVPGIPEGLVVPTHDLSYVVFVRTQDANWLV